MLLDQEDYQAIFGPLPGQAPVTPPGASTWQQIARGGVSGLTFGLDKPLGLRPYEEAGPGGWPETAAWLTGMGVGFPLMTKFGAGPAIAGAGAVFPKLLAAGVKPGAAVAKMLTPGFGVLPKTLSDAGRLSAYGLSGAAGAVLPELAEPEKHTLPGILLSTALGAGLGAGGARLAGIKWRGSAPLAGIKAAEGASAAPGVVGATGALFESSENIAKGALQSLKLEMDEVAARIANAPNRQIRKAEMAYHRLLQRRVDYLTRRTGIHPPTGPLEEDLGLATLRAQQPDDLDKLRQVGLERPSRLGPSAVSPPVGADLHALRQVQAGISTMPDPLAAFGPTAQDYSRIFGRGPAVGQMELPLQQAGQALERVGVAPSPVIRDEAVRTLVARMSDEQVQMFLKSFGVTTNLVGAEARSLLGELLGRRALPVAPTPWAPPTPGSVLAPLNPAVRYGVTQTERHPLVGRAIAGPGRVLKALKGPFESPTFPPGVTPVLNPLVNPAAYRARVARVLGREPEADIVRPEVLDSGYMLLRNSRGNVLPPDVSNAVRAARDIPFPEISNLPPPISGGSGWLASEVPVIRATGYSNSTIVQALARHGWLPVSWAVAHDAAGTQIVNLLTRAEGQMAKVVEAVLGEMAPALRWTPDIMNKVKRIFYQKALTSEDEFFSALQREAPEAVGESVDRLRDVMDRIFTRYVADGVISPERRITNYLPVYRDKLRVVASGELHIERGQGYIPVMIDELIRPKLPPAARRRSILTPEDYPQNISFPETLKLYATQYARHVAIREIYPELKQTLAQIKDPAIKQYMAEHVNYWLGASGKPTSEFWRRVREVQFARTIGFSVLSPFVNTLQRLNTFAVVRPASFFQAFKDAFDPERMALVKKAGLGLESDVLRKMGIEEALESTGAGRFWDKLVTASGKMFSASERGNKTHAFLAGLRDAEAKGVVGQQEQIEFARKVMNETQFIHTRANLVPKFRGDIGRTFGQFQTFRLNQTHFMLRLLEEAQQGVAKGEWNRTLPFIKFWVPSLVLAGAAGLPLGQWGEEEATRAIWKKAFTIEGLPELLFGVSLQHQLGLGTIGAEDLNSWMFYLPGPFFGHVQGLVGTALGVSVGRGVDLSTVGRPLSPQERASLIVQSLPGGVQTNRIITALRLVQNDSQFRQALDMSEAFGLTPSDGKILSDNAATLEQIILQAAGLPPAFRGRERYRADRDVAMKQALSRAHGKATDLLAAGRVMEAMKVMSEFNESYKDVLPGPVAGPTAASVKKAGFERLAPPWLAKRMPVGLRSSEYAFGPPASLWSTLASEVSP